MGLARGMGRVVLEVLEVGALVVKLLVTDGAGEGCVTLVLPAALTVVPLQMDLEGGVLGGRVLTV